MHLKKITLFKKNASFFHYTSLVIRYYIHHHPFKASFLFYADINLIPFYIISNYAQYCYLIFLIYFFQNKNASINSNNPPNQFMAITTYLVFLLYTILFIYNIIYFFIHRQNYELCQCISFFTYFLQNSSMHSCNTCNDASDNDCLTCSASISDNQKNCC
jgi:hypothetical protein